MVVVTPSPLSLDEYATRIGTIIEQQFSVCERSDNPLHQVVQTSSNEWNDILQIGERRLTRKAVFRESLIDWITLSRARFQHPIGKSDENFMIRDPRLNQVFADSKRDSSNC